MDGRSVLARLGGWSFRNPRKVVAIWISVVVVVVGSAATVGAAFDAGFEIPASESRNGFDALDEHFGGFGSGQSGSIVFSSDSGVDDPTVRAAMEAMFAEVNAFEGVIVTSPYGPAAATQINEDRTIAFAAISLSADLDFTATSELGVEFADLAPELPGLQVEIGGAALAEFAPPQSELIGVAFAIVVLIVSFGSVLAMGLPIAVAVAGVGIGAGLIILISNLTTMPDFATFIGAMIGLGVGIDYALFVVTRYRGGLDAGRTPEQATRAAMDTAGRAVIFAGLTVIISLLGLLLIGLGFISGMAIGATVTVGITMVASVTLLPALLGFVRERIEVTRWRGLIAAGLVAVALLGVGLGFQPLLLAAPLAALVLIAGFFIPSLKRVVPRRAKQPVETTLAYRWSRVVQAHPWAALTLGSALLLVLALPVLGLRMGFSDESNYSEATTTRRAYDLLVEGFGPGFNGPLIVTAEVRTAEDRNSLEPLVAALSSAPGVASVTGPLPSDRSDPSSSAAYLIQVVPSSSPQDEETSTLVQNLRDEVVPAAVAGTALDVSITGTVASNIDFTEYLAQRIVIFFGAVLALSFLLLMVVFRSIVVPIKAVIMNLLSIAAAYGIVVAVFQWGWFGGVFGIEEAPIEPFIPIMMFAIVFGLSMDYEVFLLSRVREQFVRTGDAVGSIADGLASTARVITAAAAIMVVIFGSFVLEDDRVAKMFGFGLAVAILLDATIVRMLLVPATMELLGARNWWLPGWLQGTLPRISIEGHPLPEPVRVRDE